ncbi:MAG TPA: hypothetical protein VN814_22980 [Caulobacteraceae bacterium]|nr:hypothetical protein [Caulobacteraceae bacterium]
MIGRSQASIITGASVRMRSACAASARTQREATECFDHNTTTALAPLRACSIFSSNASPERMASSHQTLRPSASIAAANRRAVARSSWL